MKKSSLKLALAPIALVLALGVASCGNSEADSEKAAAAGEEEGHGEEAEGADRITISAEAAQASQIVVATAGPGALQETLELTGRIMLQPAARAEIHAPYPGPVRVVSSNIGDRVSRGQTLARVESSESLQTYSIVTPIAGVVLERQTNIGDVTSETPLFVVGDLTRLQAELNVVPRDVGRVASGQTVLISNLDGSNRTEGRIASVLPMADSHSQTLVARAPIALSANSPLRPGMAIRASVVLASQEAPIVVPADAIQSFEGRTVVFVRISDDTFEPRDVIIGRSNQQSVEITGGLTAGEAYVSENAFLIKSQLGASAGDAH